MVQISGCVGIITGAASGIGAATALELAAHGGRLILVGTKDDDVESICAKVRDAGGEALGLAADVRDPLAMARVAETALEGFGHIDLVCANAGIADQSHIDDGDPTRWQAVTDTNVLGVLYTIRAVVPTMKSQRRGHVFIIASTSGRETYVGEPAYIASKWGLVGLGHALRKELSGWGIRVTIIEPGLVATPLTLRNPRLERLMSASVPLDARDVASAVVFAFAQPGHVVVSELTIRPLLQAESEISWE